MSEDQFREFAKKYINNLASADEVRLMFEYMKDEKYDSIFKTEMDKVEWNPEKEIPIGSIPAFDNIYRKINKSQGRRRKVDFVFVARLAAIFIGVAIAFVFVINQMLKEHYIIESVPYGETRSLNLPDGSLVKLNANSSIKYASAFGMGSREVWLEGEGYFHVKKNDQKFIVHTNNLDVEVLGTQFNVDDRREKTRVVLEEGEVKLNISELSESIMMKPGDLVSYSKRKNDLKQKIVATEIFTSWKEDLMVFEATPLWEVAQKMEDIHGIKIQFANELDRTKIFTGTYGLHEPHTVITALEIVFGFETKMTKDLIIFK